ncbi:MAG: Tat pathway signal protein, partial [Gemmatimonadetes bacterium]|nr:Tat pathway signal protein [Gemmatimonadota bacterium]
MHKLLTAGLLLLLLVPHASAISEEALLDSIQRTSFAYFWNEANPSNGLVKDRDTGGSPASIASVGFGLSAICVAIDHGWITRSQGVDRVLTTLQTFWTCPQNASADSACGYRGLFYHFLDMNTGLRAWSSELSTIDTGLLFAGILHAREYFDTNDSLDIEIRAIADSITQRAEWDFTWTGGGIKMGWTPETGFNGFGEWVGYNEAMIMYIIAFGSPTHPVPGVAWNTWTNNYFWGSHYGYQYVEFPPLFGHQYSHCWIDFRNIHDTYMQNKGITYFENSRRATLAQRAYCIDNPGNQIG